MLIRILILLLVVVSCSSTKPTPYQKEKKHEGYSDSALEDLQVAVFKANSYTKKDDAKKFAEFRAIEQCLQQPNMHANIIDVFDKTVEKDVVRTTGSSWGPSYGYGYGMYPYYSRYPGFGFGIDYNTVSGTSWNEKLVYPAIEVLYVCREKIYRPKFLMKEISAEQMKLLVKDLKGALQIEKISDDCPNKKKLELGDIILKANGKRIEKVYELIRLFVDKDSSVTVSMLREGRPVTAKITALDITDEVSQTEKHIIHDVCKHKDKQEHLKQVKLCQ